MGPTCALTEPHRFSDPHRANRTCGSAPTEARQAAVRPGFAKASNTPQSGPAVASAVTSTSSEVIVSRRLPTPAPGAETSTGATVHGPSNDRTTSRVIAVSPRGAAIDAPWVADKWYDGHTIIPPQTKSAPAQHLRLRLLETSGPDGQVPASSRGGQTAQRLASIRGAARYAVIHRPVQKRTGATEPLQAKLIWRAPLCHSSSVSRAVQTLTLHRRVMLS